MLSSFHKPSHYLLFFLLALALLAAATCAYGETRSLKITARDPATGREGEVPLYNKTYAVIIGIDQYPKLPGDRQLTYAVRDAQGVESVLKRLYRFTNIYTLYNKEATRDRILELLTEELPSIMSEDDSLLIFWAGHGNQEKSREGELGYLIPYDGTPNKIRTNITMAEIRDTISKRIPAKHVLYVMDACYSGLLTATRAVDSKPRRDLNYLTEITRERVRQVLTAGAKDQEVLDGGPKGHSVFTGRLIEVLEQAGDFVTANELQAILREKVYGDARARNHHQTPGYGTLYGSGDYVFIPSVEQKLADSKAELARMEAELKQLEAQEAAAEKELAGRARSDAEHARKAVEAKLKAEQSRKQRLADEQRHREEAEREQQRLASLRADDERRLAALKADLERKRLQSGSAQTLAAAVAEIKRLSGRIDEIEAVFEKELSASREQVKVRYDRKLSALAEQRRDEFETERQFAQRIERERNSLTRQRDEELAELDPRAASAAEIAPLKEAIRKLAEKEYTLGPDSLALEVGQYDPEQELFPISISSKDTQPVKVAMNGTFPLPVEAARQFKKNYESGLVQAVATIKAGTGNGEITKVAISNDADEYILEYHDGQFLTVAERKRRMQAKERPEFASGSDSRLVLIDTSLGSIKLELFAAQAPESVRNFLDYTRSGFYNGTIFHRVIPGFMIQGGGFNSNLTPKKTNAPIKNEAANGLKNERGTLTMARTSMVDSATAQFFINVANNDFLNHRPGGPALYGYAVFGKVIEGMDVVDKIAATQTGKLRGFSDVPLTPVVIENVKVLK